MTQKQPFQRRLIRRRRSAALVAVLGLVATMAATTTGGANAAAKPKAGSDTRMFRQVNLVSDIPGMAMLTDPEVKNPWGIAFGPKKTPTPKRERRLGERFQRKLPVTCSQRSQSRPKTITPGHPVSPRVMA